MLGFSWQALKLIWQKSDVMWLETWAIIGWMMLIRSVPLLPENWHDNGKSTIWCISVWTWGFSSVMLVFGGVDKKDMIFNSQNYSFCSKKIEFQWEWSLQKWSASFKLVIVWKNMLFFCVSKLADLKFQISFPPFSRMGTKKKTGPVVTTVEFVFQGTTNISLGRRWSLGRNPTEMRCFFFLKKKSWF